MRRALLRAVLYVLPLCVWLTIAALLATELGNYQQSWVLLHKLFDKIEPGFFYPDPQVLSMYHLTQVLRKLAHVLVYSGLTVLTIRLCQGGRSRLRPLSIVLALVIPAVFLGVENYLRLHHSEGTRHIRSEQFLLDGVGVGIALIGTLLFFGIKTLEHHLISVTKETVLTPEEPVLFGSL